MNRKLNSNLKILRPHNDTHFSYEKVHEIELRDKVGDKWIEDLILAKAGPLLYKVSYKGREANKHRSDKKPSR